MKNVRADPNVTLGGTKYIASRFRSSSARHPGGVQTQGRQGGRGLLEKLPDDADHPVLRAHTDGLTLATTPCSLVCRLGCDTGGLRSTTASPRSCSPMPAPSYPAG